MTPISPHRHRHAAGSTECMVWDVRRSRGCPPHTLSLAQRWLCLPARHPEVLRIVLDRLRDREAAASAAAIQFRQISPELLSLLPVIKSDPKGAAIMNNQPLARMA